MEALYYNAVNVAVGGDYGKLTKLAKNFSTWEESYGHLPAEIRRPNPEAEWERLKKLGLELFLNIDSPYPRLLKEIDKTPFGIYVLGTLPPAAQHPFAIVGTRRATPAGKDIARRF